MRTSKKYAYRGVPYQLHWAPELKQQFIELIGRYDTFLTMNNAILKLVKYAVDENWLPGYIRREKATSVPLVDIPAQEHVIKKKPKPEQPVV